MLCGHILADNMADETDNDQRTEQPSSKKLEDARAKGDVVRSVEVRNTAVLFGSLCVLSVGTVFVVKLLVPLLSDLLGNANDIALDESSAINFGQTLIFKMLLALSPVLGIMVFAALAGGVLQGPLVLSWNKLTPKWSGLSPIAGFKRIFGLMSFIEFGKTLLKFTAVGIAVVYFAYPSHESATQLVASEPMAWLALIKSICVKLFSVVIIIMLVIAAADIALQYFNFMKRMRMTKQEIKEEQKESEGDPILKSRIRNIRMSRARKRMMAAVPTADVVITNPTHFAVALKYTHGEMSAPVVVAKGADHIAAKIRALAAENKVPLVENPPLARTLYATVEVDQPIKPEHYKAVAEVISYILKLKGKLAR
jgi:flagellar biosynthesis protein FlhB